MSSSVSRFCFCSPRFEHTDLKDNAQCSGRLLIRDHDVCALPSPPNGFGVRPSLSFHTHQAK